jgi:5,10-methylenetetrahydromethanopterin reductase
MTDATYQDDSRSARSLGVYVLPGRVSDPTTAITQAVEAERLGLGTVWISERYGTKDLGILTGAIAASTRNVGIASGIAHFNFRHPLVMAGMAMTAQAVSHGRFTLGVGRSVGPAWKAAGLPDMTSRVLIDSLQIFRDLCAGRKVSYDGPAGRFPAMRLPDLPDAAPPRVVTAAIGPRTLELAGTHFDGVLLHPFLTVDAVRRSADTVRNAAERAGRDPSSVRVYATVVTAPELSEDDELRIVGGRAVTYFQIPSFGDLLASTNGWDPADLTPLRSHPLMAGLRGAADNLFTKDDLGEVSRTLPQHWLHDSAAIGTATECAARLHDYLDAGANEIVVHGAVSQQIAATVSAFTRGC